MRRYRHDDDIISDLCERIAARFSVAPSELTRFEVDVRRTWGGGRVYIKSLPTMQKEAAAKAALAAGASTLQDVADACGFSRATARRLLRP